MPNESEFKTKNKKKRKVGGYLLFGMENEKKKLFPGELSMNQENQNFGVQVSFVLRNEKVKLIRGEFRTSQVHPRISRSGCSRMSIKGLGASVTRYQIRAT